MPKQHTAGRSLAIWGILEDGDKNEDRKISIHFNYWHVTKSKGSRPIAPDSEMDLLDIGVLAPAADDLSSLQIYLPVSIDKKQVYDLAPCFSDPLIATGIFNENLEVRSFGTDQGVDINRNKKHFCRPYAFSTDSSGEILEAELALADFYGGTKLIISKSALKNAIRGGERQEKLTPDHNIYFRLRVNFPKGIELPFISSVEPPDKWLLSGYTATECIDFRANETRNLPIAVRRSIDEDCAQGGSLLIERIDFLLAISTETSLIEGHEGFHKSRLLEREIWDDYVRAGGKILPKEGMVIYHWRKRAEKAKTDDQLKYVSDFNAFVKLKVRLSSNRLIRRYLAIAFFVGAIGSEVALGFNTLVSYAWNNLDKLQGFWQSL